MLEVTLKYLRDFNRILKIVHEKHKEGFRKVLRNDDLCIIGISYALYNQKTKSVAGEILKLGSKSEKAVSLMIWKSGAKKFVDNGVNMAKQISILMMENVAL